MNRNGQDDDRVTRVPEAETRAAEIEALLRGEHPRINWDVAYVLQPRALVEGPLEHYVLVKGTRRDGTSLPPIRIFWRDAARTPAPKLVAQIRKGLALDH